MNLFAQRKFSFQFEYQKFPFNARNALFIGLEEIGFMLLVCSSFVLIVMVLIPLVQEKESGVKVNLIMESSISHYLMAITTASIK